MEIVSDLIKKRGIIKLPKRIKYINCYFWDEEINF